MKNTKFSVFKLAACMLVLAGCILLWPNQQTYAAELQKDNYNGWYYENGQAYWYDNGVLARSKEVYDPQTDAWYWFEADGTMARDKDVFIVLNADGTGKWTRYDSDGRMVKGESYKNGAWYYFDLTTGAMAKGFVNLPQSDDPNGKWVYYDPITGKMQYGEQYIDGYWYYFDTATERWRMELLIFRIMMMPAANGYIMILSQEECSMESSILTVAGITLIQPPEKWHMENITVTAHITIMTQQPELCSTENRQLMGTSTILIQIPEQWLPEKLNVMEDTTIMMMKPEQCWDLVNRL